MTTADTKKKLGRKASLTPEKIIEAIQAIQDEGGDVTACRIRTKTGTGGLSNITNVMESYLKNQMGLTKVDSDPTESHILAPGLEDKVKMLISDLSQQVNNFALESDLLANSLAEKRARSAYETMIENNKKLVNEQSLTIKIFDEVEAKNDYLIEQHIAIKTELENEQVKSSALDAELSKANDELARLNILISNKEESLTASEAKNKSFEKLVTKIETRLEDSIKDKNIAINESTLLRNQLFEASSELKHSTGNIKQLKSDMAQVKSETKKQKSELQIINSNLMTELKESNVSKLEKQEQLISVTSNITAQEEILKEKDKRLTYLENQLNNLKSTI